MLPLLSYSLSSCEQGAGPNTHRICRRPPLSSRLSHRHARWCLFRDGWLVQLRSLPSVEIGVKLSDAGIKRPANKRRRIASIVSSRRHGSAASAAIVPARLSRIPRVLVCQGLPICATAPQRDRSTDVTSARCRPSALVYHSAGVAPLPTGIGRLGTRCDLAPSCSHRGRQQSRVSQCRRAACA